MDIFRLLRLCYALWFSLSMSMLCANDGEWTYWTGSRVTNGRGVYGIKGISSVGNTPGARSAPATWSDHQGNFWLFGGSGHASGYQTGILNDLWKYDRQTGSWVWVSGSNTIDQPGHYGVLGEATPDNVPGGRLSAMTWLDEQGRLWLFGGYGLGSAPGDRNLLNDLWMFDPGNGMWTWMKGSDVLNQNGVYGERGVEASTNSVGARRDAVAWTDLEGNFWLFGGSGYPETGNYHRRLNDVWKFNRATNNWIWVKGTNTNASLFPVYGTLRVETETNDPGARDMCQSWRDHSGNLWVFGGNGYIWPDYGEMNDMWKYNPATNNWTWMGGAKVTNDLGNYGELGVAAATNLPLSRQLGVTWVDPAGKFWLFGGGHDNSVLGDLWRFDPTTLNWTWIKGNKGIQKFYGVYEPESGKMPGSRWYSAGSSSPDGLLWLFGGTGFSESNGASGLNDLWSFDSNVSLVFSPYSIAQTGYHMHEIPDSPVYVANADASLQPVSYILQPMDSWLSIFPEAEELLQESTTHSLQYKTAELPVGTYSSKLRLLTTGDEGFGSTITLTLRINPVTVSVQEPILRRTSTEGRNPPPDSIVVSHSGNRGTLQYTASSDSSWITFEYTKGQITSAPTELPIIYNTATLPAGDYSATVTLQIAETGYQPKNVLINLRVGSDDAGMWTWMYGSNQLNRYLSYGPFGIPAPDVTPGGRVDAATWEDHMGRLWLFGGHSRPGFYPEQQMYRYHPDVRQWALIRYANTNGVGIYGTQGVSNIYNVPGGRGACATWVDNAGSFWLFGGFGYASVSDRLGYLNDLWKYDPVSKQWAWIRGSKVTDPTGSYGTMLVEDPLNEPNPRSESVTWTDAQGNLWMFGGIGNSTAKSRIRYNDLWKFNPTTGNWTWIHGSNLVDQPAITGPIGTTDAANSPSARSNASGWVGKDGTMWLFGGIGVETRYLGRRESGLNDLWCYDPLTTKWTWMEGSIGGWTQGIYGTIRTPAAANCPGSRAGAVAWTDQDGCFWLFGGYGVSDRPQFAWLNDLWKYDAGTGYWTWMKGTYLHNAPGYYGRQGIPTGGNDPGSREYSSSWRTADGHLWMFGGWGYALGNEIGRLDDLWRFSTAPDSKIDWTDAVLY